MERFISDYKTVILVFCVVIFLAGVILVATKDDHES